jgi:hypothetical protein
MQQWSRGVINGGYGHRDSLGSETKGRALEPISATPIGADSIVTVDQGPNAWLHDRAGLI